MTPTIEHIITNGTNLADRLHWAISRLVNHGWVVEQFGLDGWVIRDSSGQSHRVPAGAGGTEPVLHVHVGQLLAELSHLAPDDAAAALRRVEARLRLQMPAHRAHPDDEQRPWHVPSVSGEQPCAAVRLAYWWALTLTDDYGWQITAIHSDGFDAVTPGSRSPSAFRRRRRRGTDTTAERLTHVLPDLNDHIADLAALIAAHRATTRTTQLTTGEPR